MGASHDPALQALVDQVRDAAASKTALAIRGHGSKDFYGEQPNPQSQVLDTRNLRGISNYEPSELVVTARAGTPLAELEAALAECGQCLPFEPPRFAVATPNDPTSTVSGQPGGAASAQATHRRGGTVGGTVGGMVAAGLAGPARAAVGCVRDYVLGASLLNGRAQLLSFGGQVMKNVAGYDVSRLLAGSLGVLGVICEVSLKVLPRPVATATLRFELDEADALQRLNRWAGLPLPLSASAWWSGMLVLRLSGADAAVQAAVRSLGGEPVDAALASGFWDGLRDHSDEFFDHAHRAVAAGATLWRLSVPDTAKATALPGEHLVEWGGAQRWVVTSAAAGTMRDIASRLGGHATAFRGSKDGGVFAPLQPAVAQVHRGLKQAFDPDRLFNPGRLYPDL